MNTIDDSILWANGINLSGIIFNKPVKVFKSKYGDWWADKEGNFLINLVGLDEQYGVITFSSTDKHSVFCWTEGIKSAMKMLQQWSK